VSWCVSARWKRWEGLSDIEGGKDAVKPDGWEKKFPGASRDWGTLKRPSVSGGG
jgi:hypothetical protein